MSGTVEISPIHFTTPYHGFGFRGTFTISPTSNLILSGAETVVNGWVLPLFGDIVPSEKVVLEEERPTSFSEDNSFSNLFFRISSRSPSLFELSWVDPCERLAGVSLIFSSISCGK